MARLLRILMQKVPPVQRQLKRIADLEALAQQQEARLAELDTRLRGFVNVSTANAIVEVQPAMPAEFGQQSLVDEVAKRDREIRLLKVNYGATFEELIAAAKLVAARPTASTNFFRSSSNRRPRRPHRRWCFFTCRRRAARL